MRYLPRSISRDGSLLMSSIAFAMAWREKYTSSGSERKIKTEDDHNTEDYTGPDDGDIAAAGYGSIDV